MTAPQAPWPTVVELQWHPTIPFPWERSTVPINDGAAGVMQFLPGPIRVTLQADAYDRAAQCVNACAGMEHPGAAIRDLRRDKDRLAAALRTLLAEFQADIDPLTNRGQRAVVAALSALADAGVDT